MSLLTSAATKHMVRERHRLESCAPRYLEILLNFLSHQAFANFVFQPTQRVAGGWGGTGYIAAPGGPKNILCIPTANGQGNGQLDYSWISRPGRSSVERVSVMIWNPMVGNSPWRNSQS